MDLSLHGSQINLVTRYKPKPPTIKYPTLQRPGSASYCRQQKSVHFLRRPQSADEKLSRSLDDCIRFSEKILGESKLKRYSSISSSNLLKLLLDDPIKRPWLTRDSNNNRSEVKINPKFCSTPQSPDTQSSSDEKNSMDERYNYRKYSEDIESKPYSKTSYQLTIPAIKVHPSDNNNYQQIKNPQKILQSDSNLSSQTMNTSSGSGDFWHETKPDLPGRVSFSKANTYEMDFSDCENESATNNYFVTTNESGQNLTNKKTVHFGKNSEVQSQTYEYPKCPSENCTCSTRSTISTASGTGLQPEHTKYGCQYSCNALNYSDFTIESKSDITSKNKLEINKLEHNEEENPIISDYKKATETIHRNEPDILSIPRLELNTTIDLDNNTEPTNIGTENHFKRPSYSDIFINNFVDNRNSTFESTSDMLPSKENFIPRNDVNHYQNNFSNSINKNQEILHTEPKRNSLHNNNNANHGQSYNTINRENLIIDNYMKTASSSNVIPKKTLNNSSTSATKPRPNKMIQYQKPKSASNKTRNNGSRVIKKSQSYSNIRDDAFEDEYNLDNVESWMSLHEDDLPDGHKQQFRNFQRYSTSTPTNVRDKNNLSPETETSENCKSDDSQDSTYDEIVSVIKEIEEEKKQDQLSSKKHKDINFKLQALVETDTPNTSSSTGKETPEPSNKLRDILSYLEDVESSCERTLMESRRSMPETNRSEVDFTVEPDIAEDVPKFPDLLMLPNHQLARRIISLTLRANELSNCVHLSKQHTAKLRQEKQKAVRSESQNWSNRNREQKKHFEGIVARHQAFIEQLLKDKGSLCEKVTALTRRLESQNQAWEHKLETELARVKETTLAGEKIRRERWVRENTKKIKELTVKGLEVEINKMTSNHQQEITNLKRTHQQQLLDAVEETRLKYEQMEYSIREACAHDREYLIEKERKAISERFEKQVLDDRKLYDDQKNKLLEDFASERERLKTEIKEKDCEIIKQREDLQKDKELAIEKVTAEFQEKIQQQDEKYQVRISSIERQFETDFVIWKRDYDSTCKLRQVESENNIRQNNRTERDRQIDIIVSRMDAESQKCQDEFETKICRLKEKHDLEIQESEAMEKSLREKYNESRSRLAECEAQVQNYQAEIKQYHIELEHSKKMCNEFLDEKGKIKENARNEIQTELENFKSERDNEIQKIYKRVQQAIEKKDSTLEMLQKENGALRERCLKLEAVIRQQRKDYCIK